MNREVTSALRKRLGLERVETYVSNHLVKRSGSHSVADGGRLRLTEVMAKLSKLVGLCLILAAAPACKGKKEVKAATTDSLEVSIPKVDPTLCDTNGKNVVTYDLNHDNRPDVWRLYKTEDEGGTKIEFLTCKQVDANRDGKKDWVVAYNRKGNALFERRDLDFDGKWDVNMVYDTKSSVLAESERDTNFDGQYDVKEYYDTRRGLEHPQRPQR